MDDIDSIPRMHGGVFSTTHWSVVMAAAKADVPQAREALDSLCRAYWYPLYAYVRRQGRSVEEAQDLTQSFFAHLLSKDFLRGVAPEKGRFRSFLLASLKHFLADQWDSARALKRGGSCAVAAWDFEQAEPRYQTEASGTLDAEALYDRRWGLDLLDHVLDRLRDEFLDLGKPVLFDVLQSCLVPDGTQESYARMAARLRMSEAGVKVAIHRLRQRYRELLRQEISQTVTRSEDVDDEMHYLFEVVSR